MKTNEEYRVIYEMEKAAAAAAADFPDFKDYRAQLIRNIHIHIVRDLLDSLVSPTD